MISVCIAAYNGEKFIVQQLDNILSQLDSEDEVIISDDGSTDGTIALLTAYAAQDRRIHLINGPGKGVIANYDWAISHSSGDFIFLADQDDVWFPNKVTETLSFFSDHPEKNLVISDLQIVDEQLNLITASYFDFRKVKLGFWTNFMKSGYIGAGMCFRKKLKEKILPIPSKVPMHDMWIGLISDYYHGNGLLKKPLTYYRRHEENASEITTSSSFFQKLKWRVTLLYYLIKRLLLKK